MAFIAPIFTQPPATLCTFEGTPVSTYLSSPKYAENTGKILFTLSGKRGFPYTGFTKITMFNGFTFKLSMPNFTQIGPEIKEVWPAFYSNPKKMWL
jgi:hypothetical protein